MPSKSPWKKSPAVRWVIDGEGYSGIREVRKEASRRGLICSQGCIARRLSDGASTWQELLRPIDEAFSRVATAGAAARAASRRRKRDEIKAAMAALDSRRVSYV